MNGNTALREVPITRQIFNQYLNKKLLHDYFAEDAGVLMKQMKAAYLPSDARARTYGFVTPILSPDERRDVLAFLSQGFSAEIIFDKISVDNSTVANYVRIVLRNVSLAKKAGRK